MEVMTNGVVGNGIGVPMDLATSTGNGIQHISLGNDAVQPSPLELSMEELERELPPVDDGQVPLGELVSRMVQTMYAELSEMAETLPNSSDAVRKRVLVDWVVRTKKQVVKLYAVAKWARDADAVQKCMNITAFLMNQGQQFEDAIRGLTYAKESLDSARLRNHDLLTSLDVLTTGSYQRLPTGIKKAFIPPPPLTDDEVRETLASIDSALRYRLRMTDLIPVEMSSYHVEAGRVTFIVPSLFECSLLLTGVGSQAGFLFMHIRFLFEIGGDRTGLQEFPREPSGIVKHFIKDEAENRLNKHLLPPEVPPPPPEQAPPKLPDGIQDAPLVRLFNFLQMMSLSYQLEVLWYQAERMRSLGWAKYLNVEMAKDRKSFTVSYWVRRPSPQVAGRPQPHARNKPPEIGGTLRISIAQSIAPTSKSRLGVGPSTRTATARVRALLEERSKLCFAATSSSTEGTLRPSDEVEGLKFEVEWAPDRNALSVPLNPEDVLLTAGMLAVRADDLDFGGILRTAINAHARAIVRMFAQQLEKPSSFTPDEDIQLVEQGDSLTMHVKLCADEGVVVSLDVRTGRLALREKSSLAATGRALRLAVWADRINEAPPSLRMALMQLRVITITEQAEQVAAFLGLQSFKTRNFSREESLKLGPGIRGTLFIQLAAFQNHYLVLIITHEEFRYALISSKLLAESDKGQLVMEDIAWLDVKSIHGGEVAVKPVSGVNRANVPHNRLNIDSQVLRELYAYCCARVAYYKVEQQLKLRGIPCKPVKPLSPALPPSPDYIQSVLSRSLPVLCVQATDILAGAPAAEAAMPNIRVMPLNWWAEKKAQVVTSVKLKYVQQPMGKKAGTSTVIRMSKRIVYDSAQAVVSFVSENVDTCVDEFLEEWAKVSKMVVIAREVAQMATECKWPDVRLLTFDLQTVEFAYLADYTVAISCADPSQNSTYELRFGRAGPRNDERTNPHEKASDYLSSTLQHGRLSSSLRRLVALLRDTLSIAAELEAVQSGPTRGDCVVHTYAKSAGWYRIVYGDCRHALDLRLMTDHRVAILDAARSIFPTYQGADAPASSPELRIFRPIPDLPSLIGAALATAAGGAAVDIGIICRTSAVRGIVAALHQGILGAVGGQKT